MLYILYISKFLKMYNFNSVAFNYSISRIVFDFYQFKIMHKNKTLVLFLFILGNTIPNVNK